MWGRGMVGVDKAGTMETCTNCGSAVSKEFAKVFGDNDDVVHICLDCASYGDIAAGRSARPTSVRG